MNFFLYNFVQFYCDHFWRKLPNYLKRSRSCVAEVSERVARKLYGVRKSREEFLHVEVVGCIVMD